MKHLLIVDDDANIREVLKQFLEGHGYKVSEAPDGQKAVKLCKERPFDLVIVDIYMPEKDGLTLISDLQGLSPGVKIIAISGGERCHFFTSNLRLNDSVMRGAVRTLKKPFQLNELLSTIKEILVIN